MKRRKNTSENDNIQEELNMKTFAEEEEDMKNTKTFINWSGKVFAALLLSCGLLLAAAPAWSAVDCSALTEPGGDFDEDGIRNGEECGVPSPFTLINGDEVPYCGNGTGTVGCLHPNKADVFIILNEAPGSVLIPDDPFAMVSQVNDGLDITVHVIDKSQANADRTIINRPDYSKVRAAQITESLIPAAGKDTKIGTAQQEMFVDKATVYTQRIVDRVNSACDEGSTCKDISGVSGREGLIDLYIKNILAHELGHILSITPESNRRFGGHHWKAGEGFVMDQNIIYTSKKGKVTFYITSQYAAESQDSVEVQ